MALENCGNCAFWRKDTHSKGECHYRAPGGPYPWWDGTSETWMVSIWPHTDKYDYCGEFELKDAE